MTQLPTQNFRSIIDTGKVSIGELCCLVGKNEAGKTAALVALQSIRPYGAAQSNFDVIEDYPRRFATRYSERHPHFDAVVVETWWQLSEEAHELLSDEFGKDAITSNEFTISKRYNRQNATWNLPIDEAAAIAHSIATQHLNAAERNVVAKARSVASLIAAIADQDNPTPKLLALSKRFTELRNRSVVAHGIDIIEPLVPKFFYTSHYDRMSGQLSAQQIAKDEQNDRIEPEDQIFLDFLRLAGTNLEELNSSPPLRGTECQMRGSIS